MKTVGQVLIAHMERSAELYLRMRDCERSLDDLLPPHVEVAAARPLEGFFRTSVIPPPPPSLPGPEALGVRIADRIRSRRGELGMTQKHLSEETGIRRPNVARLERGAGLPNMSTLLKLAVAMDVNLDYFTGERPEK